MLDELLINQLKAENETLKQYKASKQASYEEMQKRWNEVEQENRQLKRQHEGDKGLITATGKHNYQLIQEYDRLKTENEELRKNLVDKHTSRCFRLVTHREYNELLKGMSDLRQENKKLKQTLTEIKEVLQFYNNTTIGTDKGNGIFEFEVCNDNVLGGKLIYCYDTNPAKQALQKISECEVGNEISSVD